MVFYVFATVAFYLIFNLGVWLSTLGQSDLALGIGYLVGCLAIKVKFAEQIRQQSVTPIKWKLALFNAGSLLLTAVALRYAHARLPLSLSMEAIYNGLATSSWGIFLVLNYFWPRTFQETPKRFDLGCHILMVGLVYTRFVTYGQ